tara:strand:+ start:449 stop:658 length:210 start_codon:yes stop_codon:yes gene_type:complete
MKQMKDYIMTRIENIQAATMNLEAALKQRAALVKQIYQLEETLNSVESLAMFCEIELEDLYNTDPEFDL